MIHYHGTPITPNEVFLKLAGRNFCVTFDDPRDVEDCHRIGQSVMIDNGAFAYWRKNPLQNTLRTWSPYYQWVQPWLDFHTTWCVIPDVIDGTEAENDALILEWKLKTGILGFSASPVWHVHESLERLESLLTEWPRVCFGSSGEYADIRSPRWTERMDAVFNRICKGSGRPPCWIHMLRGMGLAGGPYPFASVDSTNIARNYKRNILRTGEDAVAMVQRLDALQCPALWKKGQISLFERG